MKSKKQKQSLGIDYKAYANDVVSGKIVACEYIRLACQRFLDWFNRDDIEFREDKADHIVRFIQKLKHYEGKFAGKNFVLLPYQIWIVSQLAWYYKGTDKRVIHTMWIELSRKSGKEININTPIITPDGWKLMKDIQVGDYVYAMDGTPTRVTYVSEIFTDHKCYEVEFMDGEKVVAGAEHQWLVDRDHKGKLLTMNTQQIYDDGVTRTRKSGRQDPKYSVPGIKPIQFSDKETMMDPYTFGVWLGDGNSDGFQITFNDDDIDEMLSYIPYEIKWRRKEKGREYKKCSIVSYRWKDDISLYISSFKTKRIPEEYLFNSIENRLALLQGLMDTDGFIDKKGEDCEICQKNKDIADGICFLLGSLGIKYSVKEKVPTIKGVPKNKVYRIHFITDKRIPCFRLKRKYNRLKDQRTKTNNKYIKSIVPCDTIPTKCIAVEHESHSYVFGKKFTVTHNTYLAAAIALYVMIADGEQGAEVEFVANSRKQAGIAFEKASHICQMLDPSGKLLKRYRDKIKFPYTNSFLQVLSADSEKNDGWSSSACVIDECHAAKDDKMVQVMRSSQGYRKNPLMIFITTAGFNLYGFAYPYRCSLIEILQGVKKDDSTFMAIYTLDKDDDWRDVDACAIKANPSLDITVTREYLKEQVLSAINNTSFEISVRTKNFNEWISTSDFEDWIDQQTLGNITQKLDINYFKDKEVWGYMGVDLSAVSDLTALSLMIPYEEKLYYFNWYFLPSKCLKSNSNAELYKQFKRAGELIVMDGDVVDYDFITNKILEISKLINIQLISYDKWNSSEWVIRMTELGMPVQPYSQAISNFSIPAKTLERNIKSGNVILDNNSITRWCFKNVDLKFDWNDNIKPIKQSKQQKIDGVIAMIQALGGYLSITHYNGEIFQV